MTSTKLVRRAVGGLQIRSHGDVYQVVRTPVRASTTPEYTTRSLAHAVEWVEQHALRERAVQGVKVGPGWGRE